MQSNYLMFGLHCHGGPCAEKFDTSTHCRSWDTWNRLTRLTDRRASATTVTSSCLQTHLSMSIVEVFCTAHIKNLFTEGVLQRRCSSPLVVLHRSEWQMPYDHLEVDCIRTTKNIFELIIKRTNNNRLSSYFGINHCSAQTVQTAKKNANGYFGAAHHSNIARHNREFMTSG